MGGFSFGGKGKITPRMLENFTRLLSSLLAAGVPFSRALVILHRESGEPVAKAKWKEIHDLVIDGMSLSKAMERSPETFPRVYVAMVEAGETGPGGRIPFNTDGGLTARGHPGGPTGLAIVHECVQQLRGEADGRQVDGARVALAHLVGGGSVCTVNLLGTDRKAG